jgi:hypothetical protein
LHQNDNIACALRLNRMQKHKVVQPSPLDTFVSLRAICPVLFPAMLDFTARNGKTCARGLGLTNRENY